MKQKLLWLLLSFVTWTHAGLLETPTQYPPALIPQGYEAKAACLTAQILSRHHYKAAALDGSVSQKIFDQYLKSLDSERLFFTQQDVNRLSQDRDQLGQAILKEDLNPAYRIFNLYEQRATERFTYARSLLTQGFNFDAQESFQVQRDKQTWPQDEVDASELWRKRVKNDWLSLKLAGKDGKSIAEVLDKRYENSLKRIAKTKGADAFQLFMNAYTTSIEPHTNYFGLREAQEFDISMRLTLIGIGAVLTQSDDYTTIRELVAGGPANLSGQLKAGDRIVAVGQGKEGPMLDIMGWRQDDAVALIRGPADTTVRLDILPAEAGVDGKHKIVALVRKPINLAEQAAKSSIQTIMDGNTKRRIGVISLPSFYEDFAARQSGDKKFKSASRDVERLLGELKKAKVQSVLIDLRNNAGGSLSEAIELTGLFIGRGAVLQQRNAAGKVWVERTDHATMAWNGPMGVLINRSSASASEIFAAAMQDYGRGLIIGEPSFGKGTVQTIIKLDQFAQSSKPQLGELKMTVAQFFRVNGGTTQLRGVTPDILLPGYFDERDFGESSFDNALPWTQINRADYLPRGSVQSVLPLLTAKHEARVGADREYKYLQEDIAEFKRQRQRNEVSLNEVQRRRERDDRQARIASRKSEDKKAISAQGLVNAQEPLAGGHLGAQDDGLEPDERDLNQDLGHGKSRKSPRDIYLLEAVHILSDALGMLEADPKFAAIEKKTPMTSTQK